MLLVIVTTLFVITIALFGAGLFGQDVWFLDLWSHFQIQYTLVFAIFTTVFFFTRSHKRVVVALIFFLVCLSRILPYMGSNESPILNAAELSSEDRSTRVMFYNMYVVNTHYTEIANMVKEVRPDIVIFEEVEGVAYGDLVEELASDYPYSGYRKGPLDYFDIAYFSKIRPDGMKVHYLSDERLPTIGLTFSAKGVAYHVIGVHTRAPTAGDRFLVRNEHLTALAELVKGIDGPVVVGGDFNISPWSGNWKDFILASGLKEARMGATLGPSWPEWLPAFGRIPIDHILVSSSIGVDSIGIGNNSFSDHFSIFADLVIMSE